MSEKTVAPDIRISMEEIFSQQLKRLERETAIPETITNAFQFMEPIIVEEMCKCTFRNDESVPVLLVIPISCLSYLSQFNMMKVSFKRWELLDLNRIKNVVDSPDVPYALIDVRYGSEAPLKKAIAEIKTNRRSVLTLAEIIGLVICTPILSSYPILAAGSRWMYKQDMPGLYLNNQKNRPDIFVRSFKDKPVGRGERFRASIRVPSCEKRITAPFI